MSLPKYLYRPSDLAPFVLVNNRYYHEESLLKNPDNCHTNYTYQNLKLKGFLEEWQLPKKELSRDEHIAEFWHSLYHSIQLAGGNVGSFNKSMTLLELSDKLAQNGIRFCFRRENG